MNVSLVLGIMCKWLGHLTQEKNIHTLKMIDIRAAISVNNKSWYQSNISRAWVTGPVQVHVQKIKASKSTKTVVLHDGLLYKILNGFKVIPLNRMKQPGQAVLH